MSGGVAAALADVLDGFETPEALAQTGLFDEMTAEEIGSLTAPSPLSVQHPLAGAMAKRRAGRPKGARGRRTEATVAWLLSQHRHPLAVLAEAYSMTPAELAGKIGVSPTSDNLLDLFKLQVRLAEAVAPYVAQRLPQAVTIDARSDFSLQVAGVSFPARAASAGKLEGDGEAVEGAFSVLLPSKSDGQGRTGD